MSVNERFPSLHLDDQFWQKEMSRIDSRVEKATAQNYGARPRAKQIRDKMITSYIELQAAIEQKDYEKANEERNKVEKEVSEIYRTFNVASD